MGGESNDIDISLDNIKGHDFAQLIHKYQEGIQTDGN